MLFRIVFFVALSICINANAQIKPGTYATDIENVRHEVKINDDYFIYSEYEIDPPKFIRTLGGFPETYKDKLFVLLEFNSNYTNDSILKLPLTFETNRDSLMLHWFDKLYFERLPDKNQELDGAWLFATRGPDTGQERRGEENNRKTLKFLMDGHFQRVAYNTDTSKFFGTGGGTYTSENGVYTENITFFSRDNTRVGASLEFNYELKGDDWHHTGKNSKGEPMYEIWGRRQ
ncbi:hypothetical protein [Costertonia aggregata]|uniref:Membrane or secreted protein n=1 Tax=Costertonia aggregata TaxID=343403 RepID=A0A7H9ANA9_9FLAO|nr:hypothetical protein [Costertonia aggregata]QLG44939.1 hypothetical protein HYG79_06080 [Costertonia aggregata]